MKRLLLIGLSVFAVLDTPAAELTVCADGEGPRAAVMQYLRAMHEHRFEEAYDFVTESMTDGRTRADWAQAQRDLYLGGKVEIYGVDIRAPIATADDPSCGSRATVPNVLSSRDKLNDIGNVEFEIYHVVRTPAGWRVNEQQSLFEQGEIDRWFPQAGSYRAKAKE